MVLDKNKNILSIISNALNYAQAEDPYSDYEVELGFDLLCEIILQQDEMYYSNVLIHSKDKKITLFDEVVRVNYDDSYVFKLWKCIV